MSHFLKIAIACKDEEAIIKALIRMKYPTRHKDYQFTKSITAGMIERHAKPQMLRNYLGNSSDVNAHIVIRHSNIHSYTNDIGFEKQADGTYVAHLDDGSFNQEWQDKFLTYYGVEVAKADMEKNGYTVEEKIDEKKRIVLHAIQKVKATAGRIQITA
jgi:hypothetical protein